jgi:cation transport ATPase
VLNRAADLALARSNRIGSRPRPAGRRGTSGGEQILVGSRDFLVGHGFDPARLDGRSSIGSHAYVARGGALLGSLRIEDVLRSESVQAVAALRKMGLQTILLTGDAAPIAASIARELGIDHVEAEMLPEAKSRRIDALLDQGKTVAMVGDGVNDAPALMKASVGIAMGSGTDVARESADVLLIGNDLLKLVETLKIARHCRRIINQNFAGTLIVDGLGVLLAAFGLLNPMLAAFIHVGSELAFIANSARLLPSPTKRKTEA